MAKNQYEAYRSATYTVAKTKQIVMLYDGVIRFMHQAKQAIEENRIEDRYNLLVRASEVVNGLQGALDFENGGQIAPILYNYYASIDSRMFSIHRTNSLEMCDDIIDDLKQMRDVWKGIDENSGNDDQPPSGPSSSTGSDKPASPPSGVTLSA